MRVKIIDAWQWGIPIVSTTIGAEGIEVRPDENILLADEPKAFAAAVVRLLQDDVLGRRLRQNGRDWVESHYNWRTVYPQIESVYQKMLGVYPQSVQKSRRLF
jgi:polysaccharide biosynthesis protein PslH